MSTILSDNLISVGYLLVWILTLIWYQRKNPHWDGGSTIIITYIIWATFSIFTINDPMTAKMYVYLPLKIFPYIFLYIMLMIALSPAIQLHLNPYDKIEHPQTRVLEWIAIMCIICALCQIPDMMKNPGGIMKLITDTDAGKDAYMDMIDNVGDSGSAISNLTSVIFNAFYDICVFIGFYLMTLKKRKIWIVYGLLVCMVIGFMDPLLSGQRSPVMMHLFSIILGFMLFKHLMPKKIVRGAKILGIACLILLSIPVIALTMSRQGNRAEAAIGTYITWYMGQCNPYFNNYALDDNGIRYGDRTINLVKRLIDPDTPKNYVERREKYHHLFIDDNLFVTFVGDFCIDFGPFLAALIILAFNCFILLKTRPENKEMKLHQLLLVYLSMSICIQGGMYLFSYSDTANLQIFMMLLLYAYLRYHEVLLRKFPIKLKLAQ